MPEFEIILTGDNPLAQITALSALEPGVYGKRWNPDGSLSALVRSERPAEELLAALSPAAPESGVSNETPEMPKTRPTRRPTAPEPTESEG